MTNCFEISDIKKTYYALKDNYKPQSEYCDYFEYIRGLSHSERKKLVDEQNLLCKVQETINKTFEKLKKDLTKYENML